MSALKKIEQQKSKNKYIKVNGLLNIAIGAIGTIIGTVSIFYKDSSRIAIIIFIIAIFITTIIQLFISKKYKIK